MEKLTNFRRFSQRKIKVLPQSDGRALINSALHSLNDRPLQQISNIITMEPMIQAEAVELLGIDQLKVSALINGKLSGFSTVRLFRFLEAGQPVHFVAPKKIYNLI